MKNNFEIEFKTLITKDKYDDLLGMLNLENNIFPQTNHYFDTKDLEIINNKMVLRIRQKKHNYKLTSKGHLDPGAFETHIFLDEDQALDMLKNGFDANIIGIDKQVQKVCELTTFRASTPYKNGTLFLDMSVYYGHVDYEIEFEVDSFEQGKIEFEQMLKEFDIPFVESISKSKRAYQGYKEVKNQTTK